MSLVLTSCCVGGCGGVDVGVVGFGVIVVSDGSVIVVRGGCVLL